MFKRIIVLAILFSVGFAQPSAVAQGRDRLSMIRDAEVETIIRTYARPIFEAAGVDPNAVNIYLVNDKALNAFVAGGMNMFFNTGLLVRAATPDQVIGVIAHETGHISGGHIARLYGAYEQASAESLLAMVLGTAVAVASGRPDIGSAVMMGGQHIAQRRFLTHTRTQEASADQAAVDYLDMVGISSRGLLEFMEVLEGQEFLVTERQDPYVRTHPLTLDRIDFLRNHVARSPHADTPPRPELVALHDRMVAKLTAFLNAPARTLRQYAETDRSFTARYARAIAYYRKPDLARALPLIDELIAEYPEDPYLYELKGQMLFEHGQVMEAIPPYRKAVGLLDHPLLRISLGQAMIETQDPLLLAEAESELRLALKLEPKNRFAWRLYAIANGRLGQTAVADYAMAEFNLLSSNLPEAKHYADRAEAALPAGSPAWLRVKDIQVEAERVKEQQNR